MSSRVFCYGTLILPQIMRAVIGRLPSGEVAHLQGYRCHAVKGAPYPAIVLSRHAQTEGVVYRGLSGDEIFMLDRYEGSEYCRRQVRLMTADNIPLKAWTYVFKPQYHQRLSGAAWDRQVFTKRWLAVYLRQLREVGTGGC